MSGTVWHVNTTLRGGGVAELIDALIGQSAESCPAERRFVTSADAGVFLMTKRIHHRLHGHARGELPSPAEDAAFRDWALRNAERLIHQARPGDLMVLHDPQTAPMAGPLLDAGFRVAWRCHIGTGDQNATCRSTWRYLSQFWPPGLLLVFDNQVLVPPEAAGRPMDIIRPSIDPDAVKNAPLSDGAVREVLTEAGLPWDSDPLVVQVSRWDPLKDMTGVLRAFADSALPRRARLVLCGPAPESIADDPEAAAVLADVTRLLAELPTAVAERVHLVCSTLEDAMGNARLVNALQRRASVVVQKSLQEGFGLTVTEAMWKSRPVVATRVGGIPTQIIHERTGLLLDDPQDGPGFTDLVTRLLDRPDQAAALGRAAHQRVAERFTVSREVADHRRLYQRMAAGDG